MPGVDGCLVHALRPRLTIGRIRGAVVGAFVGRYGYKAVGAGERRVSLLVIAITIMGLADLMLTLIYMQTTGMYELNPLARAMVATGGSAQLVVFKLLTLSLSAGVLYLLRRQRVAEPAAWACAAVMCALSIHWISYNNQLENPDIWHGMQIAMSDESYVRIDDR